MDTDEFRKQAEQNPMLKAIMDIHDKIAISNATTIAMMYTLAIEGGFATPQSLLETAIRICDDQPPYEGGEPSILRMARLWAAGEGPVFRLIQGGKSDDDPHSS